MTEINVVATPAAQNAATFNRAVRKSLSTIANLAGWTREEREFLMGSVDGHPLVVSQWEKLQQLATQAGPDLPIWEWTRFVRAATDQLVESFYRGT